MLRRACGIPTIRRAAERQQERSSLLCFWRTFLRQHEPQDWHRHVQRRQFQNPSRIKQRCHQGNGRIGNPIEALRMGTTHHCMPIRHALQRRHPIGMPMTTTNGGRCWLSTSSSHDDNYDDDYAEQRCNVLALGENWTGAFGTGDLRQVVKGHNDDDDEEGIELPVTIYSAPKFYHGSWSNNYDATDNDNYDNPQQQQDDLLCASAGWGHSAIIDHNHVLRVAGQAHDWQKLFRYKRMPTFLQKIATNFESMPSNPFGESLSWLMDKYNENDKDYRVSLDQQGIVPIREDENYLPGQRHLEDMTKEDWRTAEAYSFLNEFREIPTPEPVVKVVCSAALTAVLGESGRLYIFGQNIFGQCGTGRMTSSNIWLPQYPVVRSIPDDVPDDFHLRLGGGNHNGANGGQLIGEGDQSFGVTEQSSNDSYDDSLPQLRMDESDEDYDPRDPFDILFVRDFDLGLQHGVAVDDDGRLYCWGKGDRGQLGQSTLWGDSCAALRVHQCYQIDGDFDDKNTRPTYKPMEPIRQVAAGMLHCAALSFTDEIYIWGKNVLEPLPGDKQKGRKASDSKIPYQLPRHKLPASRCLKIACGSHHTAMLFEDGSVFAIGVSGDSKRLFLEPVELIPAGLVDLPVRHFSAHMDRTTVVGGDGRQILQVQLWEDAELRACSIFTPAWADRLFEEQPNARIEQVDRCWLHSLIVTTTPNEEDNRSGNAAASKNESKDEES